MEEMVYQTPKTKVSTSNETIVELTSWFSNMLSQASSPTTQHETLVAPSRVKLDGTNYWLWSQVVEMYIA